MSIIIRQNHSFN